MHRRVHVSSLIIVAALASACDPGWPPQKEEAIEHFAEHKAEIETLEARLLATDYLGVNSGLWRRGSDETPDWVTVFVDNGSHAERTRMTGEDAIEWNEAFRAAEVWAISQDSRGTSIELRVDYPEDVHGLAFYRRPAETASPLVDCREEFRDVRCGECGVYLDDGWVLSYAWTPLIIDPEFERAVTENELSWEEEQEMRDDLFQACWREGAEIIGITGQREDSDD